MPEISGENRDDKGRFKPGVSGNPDGKPKGATLNLTKLLKEKLEEIPDGEKDSYKVMFVKTLLNKALVEKDLQSLKLIMNYVDGLPKQAIDFSGDVDVKINGINYILPDGSKYTPNKKTASSVPST